MTISNDELEKEIRETQAKLAQLNMLRSTRIAVGMMETPVTATIGGVNGSWEYDEHGLLAKGWTMGAFSRIDPVVDASCPTAVVLEKTGHVLSIPRPDLGEKFPAYAERVSRQCGVIGTPTNIGALFISISKHFARFGGYKEDGSNWPLVADYYFNRYAYLTDKEREAYDAGQRSWGAAHERMQHGGRE